MCGIVGYTGPRDAVKTVFAGLKRLEYRGYDSAGIATIDVQSLKVVKESGKLARLEPLLEQMPSQSTIAVGHTRWATHGAPTQANAHPHRSGDLALVHNGIIENYVSLRDQLVKKGYTFVSETDTEVIAHLLADELKKDRNPRSALIRTVGLLEGAYAIGFVWEQDPGNLYFAKYGSPLVVGVGEGEHFFGSDITIFAEVAKRAVFLNDGECGVISKDSVELWDFEGHTRPIRHKIIEWTPGAADKQGYRHYMLKEIHEQTSVMSQAISSFVDGDQLKFDALGCENLQLNKVRSINIVACGTAYLAGLLGKYFLEPLTGVPVNVELASEFRYREPHMMPQGETLVVAISQSGETADTLASIKHAKEKGCQVFSICNVPYSSIPRESDSILHMGAGPEIGVASTKAFTSQVLCLYLWSLAYAQKIKRLDSAQLKPILQELHSLPVMVELALNAEDRVKELVNRYYESPNFLYVGRGPSYPIALEGALKLKEISYIHAEGYAAGELKHGPIALVDHHMPVVAIVPKDAYYEKTVSNIEEICAREGQVIAIGDEKDESLKAICQEVIPCPQVKNQAFQAILSVIPVQLLSYYIAVKRGTDVDQPRNLAKSVTVE
ncbi:MAG: glutamine--fructose-6-phosphate transaminase (isomerizing) [Oligoflexus sp.]